MNQNELQNLTAALQQVVIALAPPAPAVPAEINNVKYPDYFGGDQDPITWIEEIEQAFVANRVADNRKVAVAVPRLKAGAATWWNQVHANIDRWNDPTNANTIAASFVPNFQGRYRTRAMEEGWAAELEKRRQLPGETVDAFAAHLFELFRRIEHGGNNYPDRVKARMFMEKLRPELSLAVSPFLPDDIQDAIDRAKAYEMTYSRGGNLSAYSAQQFMPNISVSNQATGADQQLQGLINQLANMMKGNNVQNN